MSFQRPTPLQMAFHEARHAYAFASIAYGDHPVELGLVSTPERHIDAPALAEHFAEWPAAMPHAPEASQL